ncbi:MAG: hypothetical protein ACR2QG_03390, partial [Gammaproteobacteria bacterium]
MAAAGSRKDLKPHLHRGLSKTSADESEKNPHQRVFWSLATYNRENDLPSLNRNICGRTYIGARQRQVPMKVKNPHQRVFWSLATYNRKNDLPSLNRNICGRTYIGARQRQVP